MRLEGSRLIVLGAMHSVEELVGSRIMERIGDEAGPAWLPPQAEAQWAGEVGLSQARHSRIHRAGITFQRQHFTMP